ncbi:anthranilate phosphoribosyltransferase, partial [Kutzneria sp. 744]|uniref:anthranilate phosphoribosyltransferase n=1 Tax=Kutzneria sp. (strain 744) TaxID=345341 RepID=UPI0003EEDD18
MSTPTWPDLLGALLVREDLTAEQTGWAMDQVMSGEATPAQIAGFAIALRAKGETADEVLGMADSMLRHARTVDVAGRAIDIVGTGGDQAHTVNISTMTAIVTAAAGVPVVKHGARASSSKCGTGDVLEELGVAIELPPEAVQRCVTEVGIGFCFAPAYHPALRFTSAPRRELAVPTAFNILGPLSNPAQPKYGLIGCAREAMAGVMAGVFASRGAHVLLVRGDDGLDEITTTTTTSAWIAQDGAVRQDRIDPSRLGIAPALPSDLVGGDAPYNAQVVRDLLSGRSGPVRDAVLLNAAGAVAVFNGLTDDIHADLLAAKDVAAQAIDSGAAAELLDR